MTDRIHARTNLDAIPLQRVVVYVHPLVLEQLEQLAHHRRGRVSRSELVREAIGWLVAREADWVRRQQLADQRRELELQAAANRREVERQMRDLRSDR